MAIPELLAEADRRLQAVNAALEAPAPAGQPGTITVARRALLRAQKAAIEQEIRAYNEELLRYTARTELASARQEEAAREVADAQAHVVALQGWVSERRQVEAERQKQKAVIELRRVPGALRELAEENAALAEERTGLAALIDSTAARAETSRIESERFEKELAALQQAVKAAGLANVLGDRMLKLRRDLSVLSKVERELRTCKLEAARVELRRSVIEDRRKLLTDLDAQAQSALEELVRSGAVDTAEAAPRLSDLLTARREILDTLQKDYETYSNVLIRLQVQASRLQQGMSMLRAFIEERSLWLPSAVPITALRWPTDGREVLAAAGRLGRMFWADVRANAVLYGSAAVAAGLLFGLRVRAKRRLRALAERARGLRTDSFELTLRALVWTVLLAVPVPLVLWFVSWRAIAAPESSDAVVFELARALSRGLDFATREWLTLSLLQQVCRPDGVGEAHFRWSARATQLVYRSTAWLLATLPPAIFITGATAVYPGAWRDSIGRLAFIAGMLAEAAYLQRVLHPERGATAGWLAARRSSWAFRLRYLFYGLVLAVPVGGVVLSSLGYHFAGMVLAARQTLRTSWLILGLLVLHALLLRWLSLIQRKLAAEQAARKRAEAAEMRVPATTDGAAVPVVEEESELELVRLSDQTHKLLRSLVVFGLAIGLWLIWVDMLPALRFLGDVPLWESAAGAAGVGGIAVTHYVTLSALALALVIAVVTLALARNIPGLLEIVILQRLPLDRGGRFATTTVVRYVIVIVGFVVAFGTIGIGWNKVQWLAAAMTVGLGFGLQETFANFVSGLILLFERPIRIGDIVTVGGVSGTVTRIHIRATTILDWDRKELIIPNKEFITGQVINWTLSDATMRIVIPIGVAYGSNLETVEALLVKIARTYPHVLEEPAPMAVFTGFGDSALNWELRVYVADVSCMATARHELCKSIDREFQRAKIEIAFPQCDVHIRTAGPELTLTDATRKGGTSGGRP